jgi:ribosome-associated translation inhibitor RaiA
MPPLGFLGRSSAANGYADCWPDVTGTGGSTVQIQLNTDNNLAGTEDLALRVDAELRQSLQRFEDRLTRVEVHLNDSNGADKAGDDKRCMLEARLRGHQPVSVTHHAPSIDLAVSGASQKLARAIDRMVGKLDASRRSDARPADDVDAV